MNFFVLLLGFFGIPFAAIQFVSEKRSLALVTLLTFGLITLGYFTIAEPDDLGSVMACALMDVAALSAVAGIINKAVSLYARSKNYGFKKRTILRSAVLTIFVLIIFSPLIYRMWDQRPPPPQCNTERIEFSIAGKKFIAPGAAIIRANRGDGVHKPHNSDGTFYFFGPKNKRDFCGEFNNGLQPANVNLLTIDLRKIGGHKVSNSNFSEVCKKAEWPGELCDKQTLDLPPTYPDEINIYDIKNFKPGYFGGGWDYKKIKEKMSEIKRPSNVEGFSFDGREYYWVEDKDHESFSLICYKTTPKLLYCRTEEVWSGDVHVNYGGRVSFESPVSEARAIRAKTWEFLNRISVKE